MTKQQENRPSNPNWLEFWTFQGIWTHKTRKGSRIVKMDMAGEKTTRVEEIEERQHEMKEKIAQMADMVTSLTKGKGITNDPGLQREPTFWKDGIDPPIMSNLNNHGEQEE